jgi:rod shape-determining protein MreC
VSFRDGPLQDLRIPLAWAATVATLAAGVAALFLMIEDHHSNARGADAPPTPARSQFDESVGPVSAMFAAPLRWAGDAGDYVRDYFNAVDENRRLKKQMADLLAYKEMAQRLQNINGRYEALLQLRTEPAAPMVTARVVADARGPFSHARLADAGSDTGIRIGNPVLSEHGVVGRVVGVSKTVSRVLLLTDVDSRTPVLVNATNARAILAGDGGDSPKLAYLRGHEPVKRGDVILTSGDGGLYPRGLPVGVADKDIFGQWRVRLYSDRSALDYVRIMLFADFSQLVDAQALNNHVPPAISSAEKAQIDQAVAARIATPRPGSPEALAAADKAVADKAAVAKPAPDKPLAGKLPVAAPAPAALRHPPGPHGPKVLHPTRTSPGNPVAVVPGQR